jgi:hypothetical protein
MRVRSYRTARNLDFSPNRSHSSTIGENLTKGIRMMLKQNKYLTISGWILTVLLAAALIGGSALMGKLLPTTNPKIIEGTAKLGLPKDVIVKIGIVEIACAVLFLIPQTAMLGAILLTGYLGGAVATHVRIGDGPGEFAAPIIIAVLVWLALFLRDPRIRALLPFRSNPAATEIKL